MPVHQGSFRLELGVAIERLRPQRLVVVEPG